MTDEAVGTMKRTPLRRSKPLARRSKRRVREDRERAQLLARLRAERGNRCQAHTPVCTGWAHDGHETLSRARSGGTSALDERWIILVCRPCHDHIHAHPAWAAARGLLTWSWDANGGAA